MFYLQGFHDGVGDPLAGFVNVLDPAGRDPQACGGRCATPIAPPRLQGPHGLPRPRQPQVAEPPMRQRVPLRAAWWSVPHGHAQPQPVTQLALEWCFPQPGTTPMTSPRLRQDHEWPGVGVSRAPDVLPPVRHRPDGPRWRLRRGSNIDGTRLALHSVDPRGHCASERVAWEIMHVDRDGVLTPALASVLDIAPQGFRLRVPTDDRLARRRTRCLRRFNGGEWRLTVRMVRPGFWLVHVDPPRGVMRVQHAADGRRAGRRTGGRPPMTPRAPTTADPLPLAPWVTRRFRRDQAPQGSFPQRVFCSARGRPAPGTRTRSGGRSARDTASSCRPRRIGCGSSPVMCATTGSPPWPRRWASRAADHRRCCSSRRDSTTFM
jgi:hypothetical protein